MPALFRLVDAMGRNQDLGALVRLGKVIHYEGSAGAGDRVGGALDNWPGDVLASRFWTSDGQAEIKRNEALVRVWRRLLALANRTLTDWADPEGRIGLDILLAIENPDPNRPTAMSVFDTEAYERKADLLFGSRAGLFKRAGDEAFEKAVLTLALQGTRALHHASFHFKGLGAFAEALAGDPESPIDPEVVEAVRGLWDADFAGRAERLRQTIRADHFE
jgi:hypothetical protein